MDWDKLRIFHAVAEAGSFTRAGEQLNLSQSAVSRQIGALEESLKTPLFHRHARGLILTEQGELLYRAAHEVSAKLAMTAAVLTDLKDRPSGELKVTTTVAFGSIWVAPLVREFVDLYPEVSLSMVLDDSELDLSMRQADVALRMRKPVQGDLVHRKLLTVHYHLCAAPDYLRRHGTPKTIEELDGHRLIVYGDEAPTPIADVNWLIRAGAGRDRRRHPTLRMNNIYGIKLAMESGLGIAALPDYIVHGSTRTVRVLPNVDGPSFDMYFVYPEELRNSKRIAVFRDFLVRKVAEWKF